MTAYCPACLDVWCLDPARVDRGDFVNIKPGVRLHVACGRALDEIRKAAR